jgi:drug/metabolite transporter (DMT)-like permease
MADSDKVHEAGWFDIRNFVGVLLGVYGVILTAMGIFADTESAKTGNVNANLWAGLALLVAAVVFLVWARVRPILVPADVTGDPGPAHMDEH